MRRSLQYRTGGLSGVWEGEASFTPLEHSERDLVAYLERGRFRAAHDRLQKYDTRNRLLYDFTDSRKVDVYVDDEEADRSTESVLRRLRFLYSLNPETLLMKEHLYETALYRGEFEIEAPHAWLLTWKVSGPQCDGIMASLFSRRS